MAAIIVGIHGLANKPEPEKLAKWWEAAIREGLRVNEGMENPNFRFEMVYWADLLYRKRLHHDPDFKFDDLYNAEPYIAANPGALEEHDDNFVDWARAVANRAGGSILDLAQKHFGTDAIGLFVIDRVLRDLAFYYDETRQIKDREDRRGLARRVLMDELKDALLGLRRDDEEVILIAHSMGSIIAYDVLREIGRVPANSFDVDHFITIGSPLGLPTVKTNVYEANRERDQNDHVRTPTIVSESWTNFADRGDLVSFDNHLRDDFGQNDNGVRVRDDVIRNDYVGEDGKRNHHKSYGYLRTPEMSRLLSKFV